MTLPTATAALWRLAGTVSRPFASAPIFPPLRPGVVWVMSGISPHPGCASTRCPTSTSSLSIWLLLPASRRCASTEAEAARDVLDGRSGETELCADYGQRPPWRRPALPAGGGGGAPAGSLGR